MWSLGDKEGGFTLVELIAVLVIIGVLAGTAATRLFSPSTYQLQAARDLVVTALYAAQQRAMTQSGAVQFIASADQIDLRQDVNGDGVFSPTESIWAGGQQYPVAIEAGVSLSPQTLSYDRLGRTSAASISVTKGSATLSITVTASGYAY